MVVRLLTRAISSSPALSHDLEHHAAQGFFASLIRQCGGARNLEEGRRVHESIVTGDHLDRFLANHLVEMYGKCGSVEEARSAFENIAIKNVYSWTLMIGAYAQNGHPLEALDLFHRMDLEGMRPDDVTFLAILGACSSSKNFEAGRDLHARIVVSGIAIDVIVGSALVHFYCKCGMLDLAREVFAEILDRNILTWTSIIAAHVENGLHQEAMDLFRRMQLDGVAPDRLVMACVLDAISVLGVSNLSIRREAASIREWIRVSGLECDPYLRNGLITMYGKWGLLEEAKSILFRKNFLDTNIVSWTAMVSSYSKHGRADLAVELFYRMNLEGVKQDKVSIVTILDAMAHDPSKFSHDLAVFHDAIASCGLESNTTVGNSLVNLYGKSGQIERAMAVFRKMIQRDIVSWGSIITAFAQSGESARVLAMLREMDQEGEKADAVVFVSAIDACKSSSRLADGKILHARAIARGVEDHIQVRNSLLDMYSKCGRLDLAEAVFSKLRQRDTIAWNSIVISFAQHGHWIRAKQLFQEMHLEGVDPSRVTLISILSACRHAGLLEEARRYFVSMLDDHGLNPALYHYGCMIDLLGRAGWIDHAAELVREMPIQPAITSVTALLGSCRIHGDVGRGSGAAEQAMGMDLDREHAAGGLVLLSNLYAGDLSSEI